MLLNNQWVNEEIKREIKKYFETSKIGNTTYQNIWNAAKAVLKWKLITIKTYIKKKKKSSNNVMYKSKNQKKKNKLSSQLVEETNNKDQSINK